MLTQGTVLGARKMTVLVHRGGPITRGRTRMCSTPPPVPAVVIGCALQKSIVSICLGPHAWLLAFVVATAA